MGNDTIYILGGLSLAIAAMLSFLLGYFSGEHNLLSLVQAIQFVFLQLTY